MSLLKLNLFLNVILLSQAAIAADPFFISDKQVLSTNGKILSVSIKGRLYGDRFFVPDSPINNPEDFGLISDSILCYVKLEGGMEGVWRGRAILDTKAPGELRARLLAKGFEVVRDFSVIGKLVVQAPHSTCDENRDALVAFVSGNEMESFELDLIRGQISYQ